MNEENKLKLSDKEFQKLLTLMNSISKTMKHRHNVAYDTAQSYCLDIFAENKDEVISLFRHNDIGYLKNYLTDRLRKKFKIQRVTLKDRARHTFKLNLVVEQLESIGKFDILADINEELNKIFTIEYSKIKNSESENLKKTLLEIEIKGKPSLQFIDEDILYIELEKRINNLGSVKLTSLGIQVNKRVRVCIDNFLQYIDFSDELIEPECKKELFYRHLEEFELNDNEQTFVNLTFKGYNIYSDLDIDIFQDSIKPSYGKNKVSKNYLRKTFIERLCNKLTEKSPFID